MMQLKHILAYTLLGATMSLTAQHAETGPVIDDFGAVYKIPEPEIALSEKEELKAIFEISDSAETPGTVNRRIESGARFLNINAQSGISQDRQSLILVIHGTAVFDLMNNTAYSRKFGISNPNTDLIKSLSEKNVRIVVCGQSVAKRKLSREMLVPEVEFAPSAMMALVKFQNEDYRPIKF
ncbi:DsrE family protein [Robertkochia aurantiaca]|uniref:DsrE family protein n=1 Tax=Robertkochia aurantiaca TaxID=2873700 RepID=UPI001CCD716C|nr:DsrE family protein [Robertkochia sp. 3YJGBD-33]